MASWCCMKTPVGTLLFLPKSPHGDLLLAWSLELTSSIVLVILDEERDGVKHILLSHVVPLGAVVCFFDVIMFYTGVLT